MNPKITALPILALVISLSTIGFVNAESNGNSNNNNNVNDNKSTDTGTTSSGQTSASCSQDQITAAKQGLAEIQKKMAGLKMESYNNWQTAHNSGQYNGTFEQYSREKITSSPDVAQIKSDYQKYSSILKSCGVEGYMMKPTAPSSTTCSQDDIAHARQELATSEKQGNDLKVKVYQQFQADRASGKFNGTWEQYAKENFLNLPEVAQLKSTHDKYDSFLKRCYGNQAPDNTIPQNPGDNSMPPTSNTIPSTSNTIPSTDKSQKLMPTITTTTDASSTLTSSHGIPAWVKGVVGWWAEGKISDDDFVNAIKFLVHQGIIKL